MTKKATNKKASSAPPSKSSNQDIIEGLLKMQKNYEIEGNRGKVMGYQRAIAGIRSIKDPIVSVDQLDDVPGVGKGMKDKVKEYLSKGVFREAIQNFSDAKMDALKDFNDIWGVGNKKALELYAAGYKSIAQLKAHEAKKSNKSVLTSLQSIGLKYFDDLRQKMPRNEAG